MKKVYKERRESIPALDNMDLSSLVGKTNSSLEPVRGDIIPDNRCNYRMKTEQEVHREMAIIHAKAKKLLEQL